jgi:hypothetical protein
MKTATALTITAIGAIFAFAITAHPSFLNLQVVGWVLILTGVSGLLIPRRGRGWLRRTVLVKGSPDFTASASSEIVEQNVTEQVVTENAVTEREVTTQSTPERTVPRPGSVIGQTVAEQTIEGTVESESIVEFIEK